MIHSFLFPTNKQDYLRLIFVFTTIKILIHLFTNAFAGYGLFRDELYYIASTDHLSFGYVDHPPLSIWFLALVIQLFGKSLFAIRLFPALLSGIAVFSIGLTTYELGGKRNAVMLACMATIVSGIYLAFSTYYSMNVLDLCFWSIAIYLVVMILKTQRPKFWILFGFVLGLALLNKIGALFFGAGLLVSLLFFERRLLLTKWPYITAVIALTLFLPYIIWNIVHEYAHLEFIENASKMKYSGLSALSFWKDQLLIHNPVNVLLWLSALIYVFSHKSNRKYKFLFVIFSVVALIFTINGTSKAEYLAAIFPVLFMGGALQWEAWSQKKQFVFYIMFGWITVGLILAPLAIPILPVHQFIQFQAWVGLKPENTEGKATKELPQFYADMHGWEEKAKSVSAAYLSLSNIDQKVACVMNWNYGRAGALEYYKDKYALPPIISGHNSYWLWGSSDCTGEVILLLDQNIGDFADNFESAEDLGIVTCEYCMPYEDNLHIYLYRGLKYPIQKVWPYLKHFE